MQFNFLFRLMDPNASLLFIIFHSELKMLQKRIYKFFSLSVLKLTLLIFTLCKV